VKPKRKPSGGGAHLKATGRKLIWLHMPETDKLRLRVASAKLNQSMSLFAREATMRAVEESERSDNLEPEKRHES